MDSKKQLLFFSVAMTTVEVAPIFFHIKLQRKIDEISLNYCGN